VKNLVIKRPIFNSHFEGFRPNFHRFFRTLSLFCRIFAIPMPKKIRAEKDQFYSEIQRK